MRRDDVASDEVRNRKFLILEAFMLNDNINFLGNAGYQNLPVVVIGNCNH